ncbi:hypothetical protein GJ744_011543 [Endocarpon pusillum]|uniref:Uncharacterized protein n=1 Tax=Endocarpon pusillum TaxID=364733 RepID=A0A8H7AGD4_9EURO|nr:hypothetical protein GJ744_011543 [Endocarpon pusillum]
MGIALKKPADVAGSAAPAMVIAPFVSFGCVLFGQVSDYVLCVHLCWLTEIDMHVRHWWHWWHFGHEILANPFLYSLHQSRGRLS